MRSAGRHEDHHTLTGPGQQDPVGVFLILSAFFFLDPLPSTAFETEMFPAPFTKPEISVSGYQSPIQFQALHVKPTGHIFQVIGRTHIIPVIQKPQHRIYLITQIDRVGLKPFRVG